LNKDAILPERATAEVAGMDLYAIEEAKILPQSISKIGTGIAIALSHGTYGRL